MEGALTQDRVKAFVAELKIAMSAAEKAIIDWKRSEELGKRVLSTTK